MKTPTLALTLITTLFFTALTTINIKAQNSPDRRLYTVNDTGDSNDADTADLLCRDSNGKCTLRAALDQANATGINVINFALPTGSVINLTLGELRLNNVVHIVGTGARNLTIQRSSNVGTPSFRIFHIIQNLGPRIVLRGFTVQNGNTDQSGGAFYIESGNGVYMTDVKLSNNSAGRGGAIANAGSLFLTRSLINSNSSTTLNGSGGGLMNIESGSSAVISNSTFTGNAALRGGAIFNQGNLTLVNDTMTANAANENASNTFNDSGATANVLNTIVGIDNGGTVSSLSGAFNSLGNNIVSDARNSTGFVDGVNGDQVSNDNSINPGLENLANNGGQTDTFALTSTSPAINRGNNCVRDGNCLAPVQPGFRLSSDQRTGYSRRADGIVDVGAFEKGGTTLNLNVTIGFLGSRRRLAGSLVIFTKGSDNSKRYTIVNPAGNYGFNNLQSPEVYIFEIRSKRAGLSFIDVFEMDNLPIPFLTDFAFGGEDFKITLDSKQGK
jgi:hypothetical protein